jgi:hypothetical protein
MPRLAMPVQKPWKRKRESTQGGTDKGVPKSYSEKLSDPRWQKKRLQILEKSEWSCLNCGDSESQLHVHHLFYEKGKQPWEYDDQYLIPVCKDCHEGLDAARSAILKVMSGYPPDFLSELHMALCDILEPINNGTHPYERWTQWMKSARKIRNGKK